MEAITNRRKRWPWILALALIIIGTAVYQLYFVSTNAAIRHAEAFLFRRMSVAQLADQGSYRFFYASNREPGSSAGEIAERFTSTVTDSLSFGSYDTTIEPNLGLGMLINPTQWLQDEEIQLQDVNTLDEKLFIQGLRDQVAGSSHQAVLVALHGFRENYESALRKTAFLGHVLDIDAPVLLFDWPGDQGSSLRGYRRARSVASESGTQLAELLMLLATDVQPREIWILANSMGAQVVVDAMQVLHGRGQAQGKFQHIVLTAPDVDHRQFNEQFKQQLDYLSEHLTVYVSSNDRALLVSRVLNRGARRGESTLSPEQLDEAERILDLTARGDKLVNLVDVTPVNRTRNFHNFSLETPEFFDDLFLRLTNPQVPNSRPIYHVQTPEGKVYSVLTRGR